MNPFASRRILLTALVVSSLVVPPVIAQTLETGKYVDGLSCCDADTFYPLYTISLGEGFTIRSGFDVCKHRAADLEVMCELGVKRNNTVSMPRGRSARRPRRHRRSRLERGLSRSVQTSFHRLWKSLVGVMPQPFANRKLRRLYQFFTPPARTA